MLTILIVFFVLCMVMAMVTDTFTQKIPNWLNFAVFGGFVLSIPFVGFSLSQIGAHLLLSAVVFGVGYGLYCLKAMGAGDVKLMVATAPWLGLGAMTHYIIAFSVIGGGLCVFMILARRYFMWQPVVSIPWVQNWMLATGVPYGLALGPAGLYAIVESPIFRTAFPI